MRIEYFQIYGKDERNLKWDNLDQIKFDASAQLRSTSTLIQQSGPGPDGAAWVRENSNILHTQFGSKIKNIFIVKIS